MENITNAQKANILARALPNIQMYRKKTIVVKYGGNAMINDELKEAVMRDLVLLSTIGIRIVLVHGGGPEISATLKAMHIESRFVDGLRVTDRGGSGANSSACPAYVSEARISSAMTLSFERLSGTLRPE